MESMVKRSTTDFDAIVIGAGHNGLVTAAYLAKSGLSTLLIEARSDVGGTAASDSFAGASVNICNCDHLTFRTTPVAEELNLGSHGLEYINIEPPQINGDWTSEKMWPLWHDVEQTIESLASVHADAIDGYRKFARATMPVARLVLDTAANPPTRGSLLASDFHLKYDCVAIGCILSFFHGVKETSIHVQRNQSQPVCQDFIMY